MLRTFRGLRGQPVWPLEATGHVHSLSAVRDRWERIRDEGLAALGASLPSSGYVEESENLRQNGMWRQLVLFENGRRSGQGCRVAADTCKIIEVSIGSENRVLSDELRVVNCYLRPDN